MKLNENRAQNKGAHHIPMLDSVIERTINCFIHVLSNRVARLVGTKIFREIIGCNLTKAMKIIKNFWERCSKAI